LHRTFQDVESIAARARLEQCITTPNLEGEVRPEAERQLQAAALQDGILNTANKNARQTLTTTPDGPCIRECRDR